MDIIVDDDFARFGAKSYAINKINSVEVRERQPHGRGWAVLWGSIAVLFLISALGSIGDAEADTTTLVIIAAVFVGLAYWQWVRSAIREYQLFLMTSSSEAQAFITRDHGEVSTLRERIESAMLRHSRAGTDR